jgi:hypothetical protein
VNGEQYQILSVPQAPVRGGFPVSWNKVKREKGIKSFISIFLDFNKKKLRLTHCGMEIGRLPLMPSADALAALVLALGLRMYVM